MIIELRNSQLKFQRIDSYQLEKAEGTHSSLRFSALLDENGIAAACRLPLTPVTAYWEIDGRKGRALFSGVVTQVRVDRSFSRVAVDILAQSATILLDQEPAWRIFQSEKKTLGDVAKKTGDKAGATPSLQQACQHVRLNLNDGLTGIKMPLVDMQDGETDFAFCQRIADTVRQPLWVDDWNPGNTQMVIASQVKQEPEKLAEADIISLSQQADITGQHIKVELRRFVDTGRVMSLSIPECEGKRYVVKALSLKRKQGVDTCCCEMELVQPARTAKPETASLLATQAHRSLARAISNKDPQHRGRIQIKLDAMAEDIPQGYEVMDEDKELRWVSYRSPYVGKVGGMVFLPDIGDMVETTIIDGECCVAATIRTKHQELKQGELAEAVQHDEKYLGNNDRRRIIWKKETLELRSGESRIIMSDKDIELVRGDSSIRLDDKGITVKNRQSSLALTDVLEAASQGNVTVDSKGQLSLQSHGSAKLLGQGQVQVQGGTVNVKSNGTLALSGSTVNLC